MGIKLHHQKDQPAAAKPVAPSDFSPDRAVKEIDDWDQFIYRYLVSTELTPEQVQRVADPAMVYPKQKNVLALHWHPEWIPLDLIARRIEAMFPNRESELVIPTQHNQFMTWGDYAGVEIDCYASGFNRKVQLLLHLRADKAAEAGVLRSMLNHTFKYRASQLFEFMDSIVNPNLEERLQEAATETGANAELVALVRFYTARLRRLIEENESLTSLEMIKNKLVSEFIDAQRRRHPDLLINRALLLVKAVKNIVKRHFSLDYFFRASEVIEETRSLGGGIVIPHPEQFWPILLADYDVDGYEVWNPESREYTEFLITALNNQNKRERSDRPPLLIFMGDDTHMSVKIRDSGWQERSKLEREIGLQPAWEDIAIRKSLSLANASRARVIELYRERLG